MQEHHQNELKELKRLNVMAKRSIQLFDTWKIKLRTIMQTQLVELGENNTN